MCDQEHPFWARRSLRRRGSGEKLRHEVAPDDAVRNLQFLAGEANKGGRIAWHVTPGGDLEARVDLTDKRNTSRDHASIAEHERGRAGCSQVASQHDARAVVAEAGEPENGWRDIEVAAQCIARTSGGGSREPTEKGDVAG